MLFRSARARIDSAQVKLENTSLFAPFDGVIAYLNVKEDDLFFLNSVDLRDEANALKTAPVTVIDPTSYEIKIGRASCRERV